MKLKLILLMIFGMALYSGISYADQCYYNYTPYPYNNENPEFGPSCVYTNFTCYDYWDGDTHYFGCTEWEQESCTSCQLAGDDPLPGCTYTCGCTPNWTCSGYGTCNSSDLQPCNAVTDLNTCNESYIGDYSEFTPQACDFCTPDWICSDYEICIEPMTEASCNETEDNNLCGEGYTGNYSEFTLLECSYPEGAQATETSAVSRGDIMYCIQASDGTQKCSAAPPKTSSWESTTFSGVPLQTNGVWEKFIAWLNGLFGEWNG
jgi:hypothetical protein